MDKEYEIQEKTSNTDPGGRDGDISMYFYNQMLAFDEIALMSLKGNVCSL